MDPGADRVGGGRVLVEAGVPAPVLGGLAHQDDRCRAVVRVDGHGPSIAGSRWVGRVAARAGIRHAVADPRIQVPPNCELTLGMTCVDKSVPGRTVWRMRADERFANPAGIVQGGFLGAMADSAMGSAAVTYARGAGPEGVRLQRRDEDQLPGRGPGGHACSSARPAIVSGGSRVAFAEAEVVDDAGRVVARASSTYLFTERE